MTMWLCRWPPSPPCGGGEGAAIAAAIAAGSSPHPRAPAAAWAAIAAQLLRAPAVAGLLLTNSGNWICPFALYALPIVESMGATDAESFANLSIAYANGPGLLYSADIAKVVLAFTNGTTLYKPGDSVCTYPGCTYHVSELYGGIFGGMAALSAEYLKTKMKDHLGNILFGEEAGTTTVTTTTKKKDGSSTTTTVTTTVE